MELQNKPFVAHQSCYTCRVLPSEVHKDRRVFTSTLTTTGWSHKQRWNDSYLYTIFFQLQAVRNQCFGRRGDRPEAQNVAIIITDGVPFPEERYEPAIAEAEKLRKEDGIFHVSCDIDTDL